MLSHLKLLLITTAEVAMCSKVQEYKDFPNCVSCTAVLIAAIQIYTYSGFLKIHGMQNRLWDYGSKFKGTLK